MQLQMKMPDLATTDSDIKLIRWLVQPGQAVQRGQPICEVETEKATSRGQSTAPTHSSIRPSVPEGSKDLVVPGRRRLQAIVVYLVRLRFV
jgi:hypothetical protein